MTESSQKQAWPVWALILDVFGTLLLAVGIYGVVGGELPFIEGPELGYVSIALIIVGALSMMPLVVVLVMRSLTRQRDAR